MKIVRFLFNLIGWSICLLAFSFFSVTFQSNIANACEMEFEIIDGEKASYSVGDVVIIKLNKNDNKQ